MRVCPNYPTPPSQTQKTEKGIEPTDPTSPACHRRDGDFFEGMGSPSKVPPNWVKTPEPVVLSRKKAPCNSDFRIDGNPN